MPVRPQGIVERLYAAALRVLPREVRREDGEAMLDTFRDQLADCEDGWPRARAVVRAFRRLPGAAVGIRRDERRGPVGGARRGRPLNGEDGMREMMRSIGISARTLKKAPAFTWAAVLLLALGIGTGTAAFTIVDHVMLRPLPYPAADRLVFMTNGAHSGPVLRRLDRVAAFEDWTAGHGFSMNLIRPDAEPVRLDAAEVTPDFFALFGAAPHRGRILLEPDEANPRGVAMVSHGAWERIWGSAPGLVGSTVQLDGSPVEIVGILSDEFVPPEALTGRDPDVIFPFDWTNPGLQDPGYHAHWVVARLGPEVPIDRADADLDQVATDLAAEYPDHYEGESGDWPLVPLETHTVGQETARGLGLLLGAVALLLLVACSNVAHLFLARGIGRTREMAVRRALGARTRQLLGQLLTESALIGAAGGALGLFLAWTLLHGFDRWISGLPGGEAIGLDLRILAFATVLSAVTAVLFGLLPALRSTRHDLHDQLRAGARGASAGRKVKLLRSGLVVGEVGVSLVLVALAGLLIRSFAEVTRQDTGIEEENVWVVPLSLPELSSAEEYVRTMSGLADAVARVPGVMEASWSGEMPFENTGGGSCCWATRVTLSEGSEPVRLAGHSVDESFFRTFGTELIAGEMWTRGETEPVAIVGERTAVRAWGLPGAALGRTLDLRDAERRIIGVAEHTLHYGLDQPHDITAYVPAWQNTFAMPWGTVAFRLAPGADADLQSAVRAAIWSEAPELPVPAVTPLATWIDGSTSTRRFGGMLSLAFGGVAMILAAGGLYGTLLYSVGEQRRAIGIRLALGAGASRIQRGIVRHALVLGVVGVVLGLGASLYLTRFLEGFLFGIAPRDGTTLTLAALLLLATAATAAWFPARRASRTDPMETLRVE